MPGIQDTSEVAVPGQMAEFRGSLGERRKEIDILRDQLNNRFDELKLEIRRKDEELERNNRAESRDRAHREENDRRERSLKEENDRRSRLQMTIGGLAVGGTILFGMINYGTTDLRTKIEDLTGESGRIRTRIDELSDSFVMRAQQLGSLSEKLNTIEQRGSVSREEMTIVRAMVAEHGRELATLNSGVREVESQFKNVSSIVNLLNSKTLSDISRLWTKVYHEPYPTIVYSPEIGRNVESPTRN